MVPEQTAAADRHGHPNGAGRQVCIGGPDTQQKVTYDDIRRNDHPYEAALALTDRLVRWSGYPRLRRIYPFYSFSFVVLARFSKDSYCPVLCPDLCRT
jgi:hypothetical protein